MTDDRQHRGEAFTQAQHRLIESLWASEQRYQSLVDSLNAVVFQIDQEGCWTFLNPAWERLTGLASEDCLGHPVVDYLHPDDVEHHVLHFKQLKDGAANSCRYEIRIRNGERRICWCEVNAQLLMNQENALQAVFGTLNDITDRKRTEEMLRRAHDEMEALVAERTADLSREIAERKEVEKALVASNEELQSFAYAVSHDLQEPLRGVINFLTLLERRHKEKLEETAQEYIQFAVDGAKRMSDMIRDLLDLSRIHARNSEPDLVNMEKLVHAAIDNLSEAIGESGAEVVVGTGFPTLLGNSLQLTRVFQNLIGNGIKYRDPGRSPKVSVEVVSADGKWLFSVADNGIGIEPQYFDRIFGVFQRLHGRGEYEGTGIGLTVVKRIVEQHGGRIWLESEPGKGSTFKFTLGKWSVK